MKFLLRILICWSAGVAAFGASGLDGSIRIQSGPELGTSTWSRITITAGTNLNAGVVNATNAVKVGGTNLFELVNGKAEASHTHSTNDITGIDTALAGLQPLDALLTLIAALTDPNADRVLFWDDSAGAFAWLEMGSNLSISGTTLNATGSGANWTASGTTNSTLPGIAHVNGLVATGTVSMATLEVNDLVVTNSVAVAAVTVNASAYGAGWNGSTNVPTRDDVYDQVELKAPSSNPTLVSAVVGLNGAADGLTDDTYDGLVINGRNAGATITQWELVTFNAADSEWALADANGTLPAALAEGIAVAAGTDGAALTVLVQGIVRNDGWAWGTVGGKIYLSETAGALTQTAPSTAGSAVQVVGWALSDDEAYLNFSGHWVVAP